MMIVMVVERHGSRIAPTGRRAMQCSSSRDGEINGPEPTEGSSDQIQRAMKTITYGVQWAQLLVNYFMRMTKQDVTYCVLCGVSRSVSNFRFDGALLPPKTFLIPSPPLSAFLFSWRGNKRQTGENTFFRGKKERFGMSWGWHGRLERTFASFVPSFVPSFLRGLTELSSNFGRLSEADIQQSFSN